MSICEKCGSQYSEHCCCQCKATTPKTTVTGRHGFELFTERLRKVMSIARDLAEIYGHDYIGPEHLLIALVAEGGGLAASVLKEKYKVKLVELRDHILNEMDRRNRT